MPPEFPKQKSPSPNGSPHAEEDFVFVKQASERPSEWNEKKFIQVMRLKERNIELMDLVDEYSRRKHISDQGGFLSESERILEDVYKEFSDFGDITNAIFNVITEDGLVHELEKRMHLLIHSGVTSEVAIRFLETLNKRLEDFLKN